MSIKKKHVLLTNDDGYLAKGILTLARHMAEQYEVHVVAPKNERSASSGAMTIGKPLLVNREEYPVSVASCFSVEGTPVDCVKLALDSLLDVKIDAVISGINRGINAGIDVLYSGTVGAAIEAHLMGHDSLAVSLDTIDYDADYEHASSYVMQIIRKIEKHGLRGYLLNVNIPMLEVERIRGIRLTRLNRFSYSENYRAVEDPDSGRIVYTLHGERMDFEKDPLSDIVALRDGYASITPLKWDRTDFDTLEILKERFTDD